MLAVDFDTHYHTLLSPKKLLLRCLCRQLMFTLRTAAYRLFAASTATPPPFTNIATASPSPPATSDARLPDHRLIIADEFCIMLML